MVRVIGRVRLPELPCWPEGGWLVGGAVRDLWWGLEPRDFDFTAADPAQAARACAARTGGSPVCLDARRDHWRVAAGGRSYDFTPAPNRLDEDLLRRDFTVNALAASRRGAVLAPATARYDLAQRILRTPSVAVLGSDPLRPLRGARLAVTHALRPEPRTLDWIRSLARRQRFGRRPAWERVRDELDRILMHPRAAWGFQLLWRWGLADVYLPEWVTGAGVEQRGYHHLDVLRHELETLHQLLWRFPEAGRQLRWAALLHDLAKPLVRRWDPERGYYRFFHHDEDGAALTATLLRRLRYGRAVVTTVRRLVRQHMQVPPATPRARRRWLLRHRGLLPDLVMLQIADRAATRGPRSGEVEARLEPLYRALEEAREAVRQGEPEPLLDGEEVMALLGLEPGPLVGRVLQALREAQWLGTVRRREEAVRFVEWWYATEAAGTGRSGDA
ncbi:HD domain-containing protein [Oceanithermus sp.]|uniref:HD domain-containing protein n=1 Tax=Oceanithermus sp. TaxID=2268145 RepID=UPI0025809CFD|nr:HD domain-containing protein [Oceanithermus sp.]